MPLPPPQPLTYGEFASWYAELLYAVQALESRYPWTRAFSDKLRADLADMDEMRRLKATQEMATDHQMTIDEREENDG